MRDEILVKGSSLSEGGAGAGGGEAFGEEGAQGGADTVGAAHMWYDADDRDVGRGVYAAPGGSVVDVHGMMD